MELYEERVKELGKGMADRKFIMDVLLLFRPGIIKPTEGYKSLNTYGMYKSYLKIGWRNLFKNKGYSAINIIGLALGMMVAILIGLWTHDELSFDAYYQNHARLAQVMVNQTNEGVTYTGESMAPPVGVALQIKYATDFKGVSLVSFNSDHIVALGDRNLSTNGVWVQPDFPEMFTLYMLSGSRLALKDPSTVLISESLAKAIFGNEDALRKIIRVDSKMDMTVGGVYKDMPANTTFSKTNLLLPTHNQERDRKSVV